MSRTLLNVNVQPVILTVAGAKPTVPSNVNLEPQQTGWLSTDIMRGEIAYNSTDDIYWYRTQGDKIVWLGGKPVQKTYESGAIELDFSYPERAELDLYELGNSSFTLSDDSPTNAEFTKVFTVIGDDNSTVSFSEDFEDVDEFNFAFFNNKKYNKIMMFVDNGVVFVAIRTMTSLGPVVDVSAPTISSAVVEDADKDLLTLTFNEAVTITTAGWSISSDGDAISISSVSAGSGTTTPDFALSRDVVYGETLTISYDSATGATTDASGNELEDIADDSVTNNVANPTIILMQDDFAGSTIDTNKWTETDPADTVTITQNDQLIFTTTGAATEAWGNNYLETVLSFGPDFAVSIDLGACSGWSARNIGFGIVSAAGATSIGMRIKDNTGIDADVWITDSAGSSIISPNSQFLGVDMRSKTIRVRHESNTLYWEYWNGSSFTTAHSVATSGLIDSDLKWQVKTGDHTAESGDTTTFDNAYITSEGFETQYPT